MSTGKTALRIVILVFTLIGLVFFLVGMGFLIEHLAFLDRSVETGAVITEIQTYHSDDGYSHRVYVTYAVGDELYETYLNSYNSSMREGQTLRVRYDPEHPAQVRDPFWWLFPIIFGGIGLIFLIVVGILLLAGRSRRRRAERLLTYGTEVSARISEVQRNPNLRINGRNPYVLICAWKDPDDDKTYLFRSENLWFNPEPILQDRSITALPVFLDIHDKRKYHVVVDSVQQDVVAL